MDHPSESILFIKILKRNPCITLKLASQDKNNIFYDLCVIQTGEGILLLDLLIFIDKGF
jgi:hypothetical protein